MPCTFVIALPLVGFASGSPATMPNIGYAASGYNIYYGNPHSTSVAGVDPGFNTYAGPGIFKQSYVNGGTTGDGRYYVPDGFTIRKDAGCALAFTSTDTAKSSDYTDSLKTAVSANFPAYGAAFTASADFSTFHERTTKDSMKIVTSVAECAVYSGQVNLYDMPTFTDNFNAAINSLPVSYEDGNSYFDFIDNFGTHIPESLIMGARYGFSSYFSEAGWTEVVKTGVDVSVAAKAEGEVEAGGSISSNITREAQQAFHRNEQDYKVISLGAKPTKGDGEAWAQQTVTEPMPISYVLKSICDIIPHPITRALCEKAMGPSEYCTKRLLNVRQDVRSCKAPIDMGCLWNNDCDPTKECVDNMCVAPNGTGNVKVVNRYWHSCWYCWSWNTFHFPPAWGDETMCGAHIFYALDSPSKDTVSINRYCNGGDNTFHPSPEWSGEHNCGDSIFYAYKSQKPGTVSINHYWNDKDGKSTMHPAPEWPREHLVSTASFYAYGTSPSCAAHWRCGTNTGDCCPSARGNWLGCCDVGINANASIMQVGAIQI